MGLSCQMGAKVNPHKCAMIQQKHTAFPSTHNQQQLENWTKMTHIAFFEERPTFFGRKEKTFYPHQLRTKEAIATPQPFHIHQPT